MARAAPVFAGKPAPTGGGDFAGRAWRWILELSLGGEINI